MSFIHSLNEKKNDEGINKNKTNLLSIEDTQEVVMDLMNIKNKILLIIADVANEKVNDNKAYLSILDLL